MRGSNLEEFELINLTSHIIRLHPPDVDRPLLISPSGLVARVLNTQEVVDYIPIRNNESHLSIPIMKTVSNELKCLPSRVDGRYYITSGIFAMLAGRDDVLCPNTDNAEVVRDEFGNVKATKSLLSFNMGKNLLPE